MPLYIYFLRGNLTLITFKPFETFIGLYEEFIENKYISSVM